MLVPSSQNAWDIAGPTLRFPLYGEAPGSGYWVPSFPWSLGSNQSSEVEADMEQLTALFSLPPPSL